MVSISQCRRMFFSLGNQAEEKEIFICIESRRSRSLGGTSYGFNGLGLASSVDLHVLKMLRWSDP